MSGASANASSNHAVVLSVIFPILSSMKSPVVCSVRAARRWPARSRSSCGAPASTAARYPPAKASPAPTTSTTCTANDGSKTSTTAGERRWRPPRRP